MEEGSVMMVGLDKNRILQALEIIANQSRSEDRDLDIPADYTSNNVSKKILRIIMSYTNQVNKRDWLKD
jgi:UDP-N-acetylglucosamine 2-epimerase (non-hydrolysing)